MHYLIIDTCVWIDLCNNKEIREKFSNLVNREKVKLIIPQLVIVEWERNKQSKVIDRKENSIRGMIKTTKAILEYLPQEESSYIKGVLERFQQRKVEIIQSVLEEIKEIENLFNHPSTIKLAIEEKVKLQAVEFALEKKAPFKEKNSMADALILLSAIDYIRKKKLPNCIFVSTNTKDFSSNSETHGIHEDLKELFDEYKVKYYDNIGLAINVIEKDLVSAEKILDIEVELQTKRQLESIGKSLTELLNNQLFGSVSEKAIKDLINTQSQLSEIAKAAGIPDAQSQLNEIAKATGILDAQSKFSEIAKATGILDAQSKFSEIAKATGILDAQSKFSEIAKAAGILDAQSKFSEIAKLTDTLRIFDLYSQLEKIPIPPTIRSCITKNLTRSMKVSARRTKITPCRTKISLIRSQKKKIWSHRMNVSSHITKISRRTRIKKSSLRWTKITPHITKILPRRLRRTKKSLLRMRTLFYGRKSRCAFIKRKRD